MLALSNLSATPLPSITEYLMSFYPSLVVMLELSFFPSNLLDENIKALTIRTQHCATEALKAWNMKVLDTLAHFK
ncbi:hypothetical protein Pfo_014053 [Paulownia fortunei]|nr:hypothetical protein Pfo_014053 [Paulownia fortunei]